MTQAEALIILLLGVIAYFLYQIARQLTFLTGKKMKFKLRWNFKNPLPKKTEKKEEKLVN